MDYKPETGESAESILEVARKRRQQCLDAESETRDKSLDDLKFSAGQQWPGFIQVNRDQQKRPCLTINKTGKYLRQVINDSRQNKPAIHVFPVSAGADQEVAEVFNGLIRDIEQRTDADIAYDTALESAARCGEGYFRLITRYASEESWDQEAAFLRIRNPFSVHLDPAAEDPAGTDAKFAFIDSWMSTEELEDTYGDDIDTSDVQAAIGAMPPDWMSNDGKVLAAEYFTVETDQKRTLALLKDGKEVYLEELDPPPDDSEIVARKSVKINRCVWRKITGNRILEKTVWLCSTIPIFRVIGEEFEIEGKTEYHGVVRDMKDAQRMYNFWVTSATEKGALEAKAPYIGAEGQFEGHEQQWKTANMTPYAYLEYKPIDINGTALPAPQRNVAQFSGAADMQMAAIASQDMDETTGIFRAGYGAPSNEKSGKAIMARQRESDVGTFHYTDNLARAIRAAGRVLVEILPKIYSTEKIVRIVGEDNDDKTVTINGQTTDEQGAIKKINDITIGRYDVRVAVGPSYTTLRQEAADSMIQFMQAVPQAGAAIMDLVAQSMDWPGAEDIAERLKRAIPPQLTQDDTGQQGQQPLNPEQVQAMIGQAVAAVQQQVQQSFAERDMQIKEYQAETTRIAALAKYGTDREGMRQVAAEAIAEFLTQVSGQGAPSGGNGAGNPPQVGLQSPQQPQGNVNG